MSHMNNTFLERISEEAFGGAFSNTNGESETLSDLGFDSLYATSEPNFSVDGVCEFTNFTESIFGPVEANELDTYLGPNHSQYHFSDHDNIRALMNVLPVHINVEKEKLPESNNKPIELSKSVGVGLPQYITRPSHKFSIFYELEEFYRPRYKSDYFTQAGKSRKPRYVADRVGNHFVSLKIPLGLRGKIRVDWLTIPTESGTFYSMPYRFQQNNVLSNVPDLNPLFVEINADRNGIMKLYLVLIKSKQDELKSLQPLKPFRPLQEAFGIPDKHKMEQIHPLTPKQLIQKYKLDKSQLAFTFCALGSDGKSCIPEWDTTVYSTVLTELSPESSKQKHTKCPKCAHVFPLPTNGVVNGDDDDDDDDDESVQEIVISKRKNRQYTNEQKLNTIKKQKSIQNDIFLLH